MWNFQRITKMFFISRGIENVAILIENGFESGSSKHYTTNTDLMIPYFCVLLKDNNGFTTKITTI